MQTCHKIVPLILLLILQASCTSSSFKNTKSSSGVKNIIFVIGDGMGPGQIGLLLSYARQAPHSVFPNKKTAFDKLAEKGEMGISMTYAHNALVTDSAASATQMASGEFAGSEMIGSNYRGEKTTTILELAKKKGMSVGLVSDTRITHATPAAFAAHQKHRYHENKIARDLVELAPDVMLSGGLRHFIPMEASNKSSKIHFDLKKMTGGKIRIKSKGKDQKNLLEIIKSKGHKLVFTKNQLKDVEGKVLGLFSYSALPDGIKESRNKHSSKRTIPTLKELTEKSIDLLSKNEKGFFLMVEAGQIDWAAHYNDTGTMLHEMIRINETLEHILSWAGSRDDTLVVVTADHETGGFGLSYSGDYLPSPKKLNGNVFRGKTFQPQFNFGKLKILDKLYQQKKSYSEIFFEDFDYLAKNRQTPRSLANIINNNTKFPITIKQAKRILATEKNPFYQNGHKYLGDKNVPVMGKMGAFYPYQLDDNRQNLLAMEVATSQHVVWSTGTHTSTPVLVFASGPPKVTKDFQKILHHTELANLLKKTIQ